MAIGHAGGVERAAHDVVTDAGQVLHAAAAHEHHRVLLERVTDARDVRVHLVTVREPDARHLAQRGVGLLRRGGEDADADAAALRAAGEVGRLRLLRLLDAPAPDQLLYGRHDTPLGGAAL